MSTMLRCLNSGSVTSCIPRMREACFFLLLLIEVSTEAVTCYCVTVLLADLAKDVDPPNPMTPWGALAARQRRNLASGHPVHPKQSQARPGRPDDGEERAPWIPRS